jgi:hypothetical protein
LPNDRLTRFRVRYRSQSWLVQRRSRCFSARRGTRKSFAYLGVFEGYSLIDGPPNQPDEMPRITLFVDTLLDPESPTDQSRRDWGIGHRLYVCVTHDFLGKALEVWRLTAPGIVVDCIEMDSVAQERVLLEGRISVGILVQSDRTCWSCCTSGSWLNTR